MTRSPKRVVGEFMSWMGSTLNFDVSRSSWFGPGWNMLRGVVESFFKRPIMDGTVINYDLARSLYRNQASDFMYSGGFVRPIIDLEVEYIGIPSASGTANDAYLNECITDYWAPQLQEIFRDSIRDSKVLVRFRQPNIQNPLFTEEDRMHGKLEVLPPESVELSFDPTDPDLVIRAVITHFIDVDVRSDDEILLGTTPRNETHEILELIDPDEYRFFDKTSGEELLTWRTRNAWKFVPIWPVYNEFASDLSGGQSDIEPILPFLKAFHEVLADTLAAHKYHSIPKAKFNVQSVEQFIANNWPDAIDPETKRVKSGAKINWQGKEIMFFSPNEDGGFIEATSVLGDSKTLLEFLIDCICIAAETPRWALLATSAHIADDDATVQPFVKKIARKRICFQAPLVMICKMALAATGKRPETPRLSWAPVYILDLVNKGQAIQQLILGFDVATQHKWIADRTVVHILGTLFDEVSDPDEEMKQAESNVIIEQALAPPSDTQAQAPSNGKTSKSTAKRALATTKASRS